MEQAGIDAAVRLEGPAGVALESVPSVDEQTFAAAKQLAQVFGATDEIRDLSNHLLGTGTA